MSDGYVKFTCNLISGKNVSAEKLVSIKNWRDKFVEQGLIGERDGIGFGNVSIREGEGFIITGTATGGTKHIRDDQFTLVTDYDIDSNSLTCKGAVKASSESLTHAAVYQNNSSAEAVIHIHNNDLWEQYLDKLPTTAKEAEYGTPDIAREVGKLVSSGNVIVMGGHKEGLISFGVTLEEAGCALQNLFKQES